MTPELGADLSEARERIRQLEDLLVGKKTFHAPSALKLPPREEQILGMMMGRERMTREAIYTVLYGASHDQPGSNVISVYISRIRKKLEPFGVTIETSWRLGWSLSPLMKDRLRALSKSGDHRATQ